MIKTERERTLRHLYNKVAGTHNCSLTLPIITITDPMKRQKRLKRVARNASHMHLDPMPFHWARRCLCWDDTVERLKVVWLLAPWLANEIRLGFKDPLNGAVAIAVVVDAATAITADAGASPSSPFITSAPADRWWIEASVFTVGGGDGDSDEDDGGPPMREYLESFQRIKSAKEMLLPLPQKTKATGGRFNYRVRGLRNMFRPPKVFTPAAGTLPSFLPSFLPCSTKDTLGYLFTFLFKTSRE